MTQDGDGLPCMDESGLPLEHAQGLHTAVAVVGLAADDPAPGPIAHGHITDASLQLRLALAGRFDPAAPDTDRQIPGNRIERADHLTQLAQCRRGHTNDQPKPRPRDHVVGTQQGFDQRNDLRGGPVLEIDDLDRLLRTGLYGGKAQEQDYREPGEQVLHGRGLHGSDPGGTAGRDGTEMHNT
ncbi:MAG: hypothetical protein EA346_04795 [Thioalkalivibrio sp.]|nr:MAG: hypothetical protein EA346_04795 [Thioalkalivibrio sp.]